MKEEALFTSVKYSCDCNNNSDDGWQQTTQIKLSLDLSDFPVKLRFKDSDGKEGSVFIMDKDYFDRCPQDRKFKILEPPIFTGFQSELDYAEKLYGYSIINK